MTIFTTVLLYTFAIISGAILAICTIPILITFSVMACIFIVMVVMFIEELMNKVLKK